MLLVCPNCAAKYDVPDEAIAPEGRDVECSNCGHGWFQASREAMAGAQGESLTQPKQANEDEASDNNAEAALMAALMTDEDEAPNPLPPPTRKIDQSVLDVLREEAGRESQARAREKRERTQMRDPKQEPSSPEFGLPQDFALSSDPPPGPRRDLLPDVEETNSALLADEAAEAALAQEAEAPRSNALRYGFVTGFALVLMAGAIYLKAADIAALWPQGAPYLTAYVTWVDGMNAQLESYFN